MFPQRSRSRQGLFRVGPPAKAKVGVESEGQGRTALQLTMAMAATVFPSTDTEQTLPGPGPLWEHGAMGKTSDQTSKDVWGKRQIKPRRTFDQSATAAEGRGAAGKRQATRDQAPKDV